MFKFYMVSKLDIVFSKSDSICPDYHLRDELPDAPCEPPPELNEPPELLELLELNELPELLPEL